MILVLISQPTPGLIFSPSLGNNSMIIVLPVMSKVGRFNLMVLEYKTPRIIYTTLYLGEMCALLQPLLENQVWPVFLQDLSMTILFRKNFPVRCHNDSRILQTG